MQYMCLLLLLFIKHKIRIKKYLTFVKYFDIIVKVGRLEISYIFYVNKAQSQST